jgi:hypothetical protein
MRITSKVAQSVETDSGYVSVDVEQRGRNVASGSRVPARLVRLTFSMRSDTSSGSKDNIIGGDSSRMKTPHRNS